MKQEQLLLTVVCSELEPAASVSTGVSGPMGRLVCATKNNGSINKQKAKKGGRHLDESYGKNGSEHCSSITTQYSALPLLRVSETVSASDSTAVLLS